MIERKSNATKLPDNLLLRFVGPFHDDDDDDDDKLLGESLFLGHNPSQSMDGGGVAAAATVETIFGLQFLYRPNKIEGYFAIIQKCFLFFVLLEH